MSQAPEQPIEPRMISEGQRRKVLALLRTAGITDRDARLMRCSELAGRPLLASTDLTLDEARLVIDALVEAADVEPQGGAS
jgi:hypothetical protein